MVKMANRKIKLGIDWVLKKGETVNQVANTFDISPRRIEQFVKIFKETGRYLISASSLRSPLLLFQLL